MLMSDPRDFHRPGDPYTSGRDRDLDLNRVKLVPLEQLKKDRFTFMRPIDSEEYSANEQLRKSTLKARSVLAACYINGDLEAKLVTVGTETFLLLGQTSTLLSAFGDLAALADSNSLLLNPAIKGLVPISDLDSGWRTQFGWVALVNPQPEDHYAFYSYIRPSIVWFEGRADSLEAVVEQRGIQKREARTMEAVFNAALLK